MPVNLPRISQTPLNSKLSLVPFLFGLFVLVAAVLIYGVMYFLIARDIWDSGNIDIWSKVSVAVAVVNLIFGSIYLLTTRIPLPYKDFRKLDDIEFIGAFAPSQLPKLYAEMQAEVLADFDQMIKRGYMDPDEDPFGKV